MYNLGLFLSVQLPKYGKHLEICAEVIINGHIFRGKKERERERSDAQICLDMESLVYR